MKRVFLFLYRLIKIFVFKLEYKKNFVFGKNLRFRDSFRVNISPEGYLKIGDNCFFNHDYDFEKTYETVVAWCQKAFARIK